MSHLFHQYITLLFLAVAMEASATPEAVESYKYEFPYREMWGKSKHRVGDYARIEHGGGAITSRGEGEHNYKSRRTLWIDIVTTDAATSRL